MADSNEVPTLLNGERLETQQPILLKSGDTFSILHRYFRWEYPIEDFVDNNPAIGLTGSIATPRDILVS